jgi:acetyltransferase
MLAGYRDRPAADIAAIVRTLTQIADLVADHPEIVELDINPLLADENGVVALDARIVVAEALRPGIDRLAIKPYPAELEETIDWDGTRVLLRPIKPEDGGQHRAFLDALTSDDLRHRTFIRARELHATQLGRLTQIDYDREMAFVAVAGTLEGPQTLGVVRAIADPDNRVAEFAIIVRSDLKGKGLGSALLRKMIDYCRARGTQRLTGESVAGNARLFALARRYGFSLAPSPDHSSVTLTVDLQKVNIAADVPAAC